MVQAGLGSGYAQQIITNEITDFLSHSEGVPLSPVWPITTRSALRASSASASSGKSSTARHSSLR
jgi:hypothetical protein